MHSTGGPSYWHGRANQMRKLAEQMKDAVNRESMLRMAQSYERIAQSCHGEPSKRDAKQDLN